MTSQQRRESAAGRLSAMAALLDAFDADLAAHSARSATELDLGRLRGIVRALLPLALDDPAFDVTVADAPTGTAVRVHHPAGLGPAARLVIAPPAEEPPPAADSVPASAAQELAGLLRRGELGRR
jgi:hypothetical protein